MLLIASMALPELDEIGRLLTVDLLQRVLAKLADLIADPGLKPDALRETILGFQRELVA